MVGVRADLLHGLTEVHTVSLVVLCESSRSNQVSLGQLRIVESSASTLNPVIHSGVRLCHTLDGVARRSECGVVTNDGQVLDHFDRRVEHATCQEQVGALITSGVAQTFFADVSTSGDVGVCTDSSRHCITHCNGQSHVVLHVARDVADGSSHGHTKPRAVQRTIAELDTVDHQANVEDVAFVDVGGSIETVVLIGSGVEAHFLDHCGSTDAGHAQVSHRSLLEECLHRVVARQSTTGSGRQGTDQVFVLVE